MTVWALMLRKDDDCEVVGVYATAEHAKEAAEANVVTEGQKWATYGSHAEGWRSFGTGDEWQRMIEGGPTWSIKRFSVIARPAR